MSDPAGHRAMLVILDGWGHSPDPAVSAIAQAQTPVMGALYQAYPHAQLTTFGPAVGLPEGQMGNSEVGHLNIGAGRVVNQELVRIGNAIRTGELQQKPMLLDAIGQAQRRKARVHLMGLLSDGGVHAHMDHLKALCDLLARYTDLPVYIHAFTDGRDVDPHSGLGFVRDIINHTAGTQVRLASIIGRYYAMDRDKRWERTQKAYDLLVRGVGAMVQDLAEAVDDLYHKGITDEFIMPLILAETQGDPPQSLIRAGDLIIFFNFRTDRPRQLVAALSQRDFPEHGMMKLDVDIVTMTSYDQTFIGIKVLFEPADMTMTIGEVLAQHGKTQLRIAETEKYPHVTYFFSGGREVLFPGEHRILIPSPKVATYDLQPEMSAPEVTDAAISYLRSALPDFVCLNFANPDMVGHTGIFEAAIKAVEAVDTCLGRLLPVALNLGYSVLIIADHGNADTMINPDGSPHTAHTMNPVPVLFLSDQPPGRLRDGILADIAPTLLEMLGIPKPDVMSGKSLFIPL
jgi:2,3-bisphosphoglycerate-independent phosphoglycerate mutase